MNQRHEARAPESLDAIRGILLACMLGTVIWAAIIGVAVWALVQ